jgi:NAD(P)H-nitrite reductase large subunit
MNQKLTIDEIKARIRVVCICKGVKQARIMAAIESGCDTVSAVHKATNSGDGGCGATRCRPVIEELIAKYKARLNKETEATGVDPGTV